MELTSQESDLYSYPIDEFSKLPQRVLRLNGVVFDEDLTNIQEIIISIDVLYANSMSQHSLFLYHIIPSITLQHHEAVDYLQQHKETFRLDLMIVDYRLREGRTGRESIDDIRRTEGRKIPAIIITGDTATERIQEAQAVDALLLQSLLQLANCSV